MNEAKIFWNMCKICFNLHTYFKSNYQKVNILSKETREKATVVRITVWDL